MAIARAAIVARAVAVTAVVIEAVTTAEAKGAAAVCAGDAPDRGVRSAASARTNP